MNNTNNLNNVTENYYPLEYWFSLVGSVYINNILPITLIPISAIGTILNLLALLILRADTFNLHFYTYLRAYTSCSLLICLLNSTLFVSGTRQLLKFTNTKGSFEYYCYFLGPMIAITNLYCSFIDVILSMERIVLLSKKFEWFRKINPLLLCLIFAIVANLLNCPVLNWLTNWKKQFTVIFCCI
jgi:hypothetical protein